MVAGTFCPKCRRLLVPGKDKKNWKCSCGYSSRSKAKLDLRESVKPKEEEDKVKEGSKDTLAKVNEVCPECKNKKAYNWSMQTRAADEAATQFYRCTRCGHTWREYA